jgi:hypothetical protein
MVRKSRDGDGEGRAGKGEMGVVRKGRGWRGTVKEILHCNAPEWMMLRDQLI